MSRIAAVQARASLAMVAVLFSACAHLAPPHPLTPIADVAFRTRQVAVAIGAIQTVAIEGEKAGVLKTEDVRKVLVATRSAALAGKELLAAVEAGASAEGAKAVALATAKQILTDLRDGTIQRGPGLPPDKLSPEAVAFLHPYSLAALALVALIGG